MKRDEFSRVAAFVALAFVLGVGPVQAQSKDDWSQNIVCRGWNNPTNFTDVGMGLYAGTQYEGMTGLKTSGSAPLATSGNTGVNWNNTVNRNQMGTYTISGLGGNVATFPSGKHTDRPFEIYTKNVGNNRDPNTGNQLPFVPWEQYNTNDPSLPVQTDLTSSIRIGTAYGGSASNGNSAGLRYQLKVMPTNALLYLYYACVFQDGTHGIGGDASFMVRIMAQNDAGEWVQASPTRTNPPASGTNQCDTLAYFITATPTSSGGSITSGQNGWHGTFGYNNVIWKEWDKVVINLAPMMYKTVRVEVMVSGCSASYHWGYAYICGECRPMEITTSGCPGGMSTDVTTLAAPQGMRNYAWYRSEYGSYSPLGNTSTMTMPLDNANSTAYYTFHQLTDTAANDNVSDSAYRYKAQSEDFSVEYVPNNAHTQGIEAPEDSMTNKQVFLCKVKSAINPTKPYWSNIFAIVQNIKPTMEIAKQEYCGGDVVIRNESFVPGSSDMVKADSTIWSFYNNAACGGDPLKVDTGLTVSVNFPGDTLRYVKVRTNIDEFNSDIAEADRPAHGDCYSEAIYEIQPLPNPEARFTIYDTVLCASDPTTTLRDVTPGSTYRQWLFRKADDDSTHTLGDTLAVDGESTPFPHTFAVHTDGVEPIGMIVRNGLFYLNPVNQDEVIWCQDTTYDTVNIFTNPQLLRHGDSIVCQGDKTKVWVTSDIENCSYQWSTAYGHLAGGLPVGDTLKVQPYADTATYYVLVTSPAPQNCEAWDSARVFLVKPKLKKVPADGKICPGDPVELSGENAHHYTWSASPADTSLIGQDSAAHIVVYPQVNTTYTLVGHGNNDCDATPLTTDVTVYPYPVPVVNLNPGLVDSEDPTLTLRDESPYSVSTTWTFAGGETVPGREVTHTFEEATGADSVYVTLTNYNELGCPTVYPFSIPVNLYTAWFPNVFTPGSEDVNAKFKLFSRNVYEIFHIYIYNRFGQLVYESSDPTFEWDGTMADGTDCPQGSYTYICRYRKPGAYTVARMYGNITLVR
ncbi:MAG: gliding motility-associated C-terminal domain-containing protein [Bacteroidales bacterium]|nr:gliding motility-associated C-terminal domain-containing protein [Bacteroidales bacterium]